MHIGWWTICSAISALSGTPVRPITVLLTTVLPRLGLIPHSSHRNLSLRSQSWELWMDQTEGLQQYLQHTKKVLPLRER